MNLLIPTTRLAGRLMLVCALAAPLFAKLHGQTVPATQMDSLVVTARRVTEAAANVPAYDQVITREQIDQSDSFNLVDLLEDAANLQFVSLSGSPTNTKVSLRGTGTAGNGRTLVLLDGMRVNRPDQGAFDWLQFSLQDIAAVEVIQGPQGAFYGDNAVGGVIKIETLGEPTASGGRGQVLAGSDGAYKAGVDYTALMDNLWVTALAGYDTTDGWRDHSGYDSKSASVTLGYDNHRNSVTKVGLSWLDTHYDQPGYLTWAEMNQDPTQQGTAASSGWSDYRRVTFNNKLKASDRLEWLTDAGVNLVREYYLGGFGTKFNRSINGGFISPKAHWRLGPVALTAGVDASRDSLHVVTSTPVDSTLTRTTWSPYATIQWQATDTVAWSAAYRHEWNEINAREDTSKQEAQRTKQGDAAEVALNYRPTAALRYYAKYDRTYRFPATDEISYYQGFGGGPGYNVFFNPNLKPEISDNYEVGASYRAGRWTAAGAVYRLDTKNEIFYDVMTNLNENLVKTHRDGVQLQGSYDNSAWGLRAQADYVDAHLVQSRPGAGLIASGPLRMTPEWRTTTTGTWRPRKGLELRLIHRYMGGSYVDDGYGSATPDRIGAVSLLDAKINYAVTENWRFFAGVNNLFDRVYASYATIGYPPPFYAPTTVVYPGNGRSWYAGTRFEF